MILTTKELEVVAKVLEKELKNTKEADGSKIKNIYQKITDFVTIEREKVYISNIKIFELVENSVLPVRENMLAELLSAFAHEANGGGSYPRIVTLYESTGFPKTNYEELVGKTVYVTWQGESKSFEVLVNSVIPTHIENGNTVYKITMFATGKRYIKDKE